ncbi:MAG: hypothetical protein DMG07_04190 [Acidobacteria bacterium]|nr:MAG: hypothetical protein DMG07_04190 [Acidobacteriota bacterium]
MAPSGPTVYRSSSARSDYAVSVFESDYPVTTVDASVDGIRDFNRMVEGTALPRLDIGATSPARARVSS